MLPDTTGPFVAPRPRMTYWVVSIALACALLYLSVRGIEWPRVWTTLRGGRPGVVLLALGAMSLALLLRAMRWRLLLSVQGRIPEATAFWATSAGYLGNSLLPARAGELIRTSFVSSRCGLSTAFVLTTALTERLVDAVILIGIGSTACLILPDKSGWVAAAARPFAVIGLAGVAAIALLPALGPVLFGILAVLPLPPSERARLADIRHHVLDGARSFHNPGRVALRYEVECQWSGTGNASDRYGL